MKINARIHFLSIEPMLGPISLRWMNCFPENHPYVAQKPGSVSTNEYDGLRKIDWVIVGGESGPGARPIHPDWVRMIRDQCEAAGVPFMFKQWGEWVDEMHPAWDSSVPLSDIFLAETDDGNDYRGIYMAKVGKKKAGNLLDGEQHLEMPK
jgi:hypothetical protein